MNLRTEAMEVILMPTNSRATERGNKRDYEHRTFNHDLIQRFQHHRRDEKVGPSAAHHGTYLTISMIGSKSALENGANDFHKEFVIKASPFTYLHISLHSSIKHITEPEKGEIDILTARTYLSSALQQYLGMTGTAIPIDVLKIDGRDVWIRIPQPDGPMVVGALSQWLAKDGSASWRIRGQGDWLGVLVAGNGHDLFGA